MMRNAVVWFALLSAALFARSSIFYPDDLKRYFTSENPHIKRIVAQAMQARSAVLSAQGDFDTVVSLRFDKKAYPLSESEFFDTIVSQSFENGIALYGGFRRSEGIQEYNNIKTSDQGEFRIGAKIPLNDLIIGMNPRKLRLETARILAQEKTL